VSTVKVEMVEHAHHVERHGLDVIAGRRGV
jgi:hypothetical protein